jgi:osmotically-inducible protein OsmY
MLQRTIQEELQWDPAVDPARIRVRIVDGVAVLEGAVRTYAEKCRAEDIVKRMQGITAVRNELEVRLTIGDYRTDETLQRVLQEGVDALARMPEVRPRVAVRDGWVTLLGEVEWAYQKRLAENAVRDVAGVRGITNAITIVPRAPIARDITSLTETARRHSLGGDGIEFHIDDGRLTVSGTVRSCAEHDELLDLAWCTAGVHAVEDRVVVR